MILFVRARRGGRRRVRQSMPHSRVNAQCASRSTIAIGLGVAGATRSSPFDDDDDARTHAPSLEYVYGLRPRVARLLRPLAHRARVRL